MQFRSAYFNARFVITSSEILRDQYGRQTQNIPGLSADFRGAGRIFDSVFQQAQKGWTDEQRLQVERYLLSHPWFNVMHVYDQGSNNPDHQIGNVALPHLGLAPGQMIPSEHDEFVKGCSWYQAKQATQGEVSTHCSAKIDTPEGQIDCPRQAESGRSYCLLHEPDLAELST